MRTSRILLTLLMAVLLASSATAITELDYGTHEISVTLQPGEDVAFIIPMKAGDHLVVSLDVANGSHVDFYLTNLTAYNAYQASISGSVFFPSLYYIVDCSLENADRIHYSYDSFAANEYVLLIDNTAHTESGATPTGPVTITGKVLIERNIWTLQNIIILVAIVVAIVLFMAFLRWPRKKA